MSAPQRPHALVTGAGRGIGAAIAQQLAADGHSVTLLGRQRAALDAVAERIGGDAHVVLCDVTDSAAVTACIGALPAVHVLVNNAGQAESAPVSRKIGRAHV